MVGQAVSVKPFLGSDAGDITNASVRGAITPRTCHDIDPVSRLDSRIMFSCYSMT